MRARVVPGVGIGELVVMLVVALLCGLPALATFVLFALTIASLAAAIG